MNHDNYGQILVDRDTGWRLVFQGCPDQLVDGGSPLAAGAAEAVAAAAEVVVAEAVAACVPRWSAVGVDRGQRDPRC